MIVLSGQRFVGDSQLAKRDGNVQSASIMRSNKELKQFRAA
jgi:hypothetical protein